KVTATDSSEAAVEVAKKNAAKARTKVRFKTGDLLGAVKAKKQFDMIISNPPYVPTHMIPILQEEVKKYEPLTALDGGEDGLDFYRRIISEAPAYMRSGGVLILETGHDQGKAIEDLIRAESAYEDCIIIKDYNKHDRVCIALVK
ncbi:MAG: HemK/PrmC family methyltransferase, partial [Bacillota bacterium]|nr:HemK/PrmC family methyltransferase [Bacillota bacterium]